MGILQPQSITQGLCKEVRIFEERTSSYLDISSHLLEHNQNSGENLKKSSNSHDYWPQNSHLHAVLDHKL